METKPQEWLFQNLKESAMTFEQVFFHIIQFMHLEPRGNFRLMIGTDSQVHSKHTVFISGIVMQNIGKGAWACFRKEVLPQKMPHLHERISYETTLTEGIATLFSNEHKNQLMAVVLPHLYKGASFTMEGHLDIGSGKRNKTSAYVEEMVERIESIGFEPKIKPESFVASCYANRFTK